MYMYVRGKVGETSTDKKKEEENEKKKLAPSFPSATKMLMVMELPIYFSRQRRSLAWARNTKELSRKESRWEGWGDREGGGNGEDTNDCLGAPVWRCVVCRVTLHHRAISCLGNGGKESATALPCISNNNVYLIQRFSLIHLCCLALSSHQYVAAPLYKASPALQKMIVIVMKTCVSRELIRKRLAKSCLIRTRS